jgi:hypothetical protein
MKSSILALLFSLSTVCLLAQVTDNFSDGNFTSNPTWSGTDVNYIVNAGFELQLNNTVAATSYLSLPHGLSDLDNKQWDFKVRQTFSPSTSNYGRVYLTASNADLTTNPDGFYVQFGEAGSTDAVRLFKIVSGISTQICATPDGLIANSFAVRVKVKRDNLGQWNLYVDASGGTNFGTPFTGADATAMLGSHAGIFQVYTASNANKFYYDDFYIGNEIIDSQAPSLVSVNFITSTQVDVLFDESITGAAATQASNYTFVPGLTVNTASIDGINPALVHLNLGTTLTNGQSYQLTVGSIEDFASNVANNLVGNFTYLVGEQALKGDVIVSEIMADPSPSVGLPELEYIEIYNRSTKYFDLNTWKLGDLSGFGTLGSGFLAPNQYVVLCATSSVPMFPGAIAVSSFPSFNNDADAVILKANDGTVIDRVDYSDTWYKDAVKKNGGYALEIINVQAPCTNASNWIASAHTMGGTPAAQNSVFDPTPDTQTPTLLSLKTTADTLVEVIFSENMDSLSLVSATFQVSPSLSIQQINVWGNLSNKSQVETSQAMQRNQVYTVTYGPVSDCWGNATSVMGQFVLADSAQAGDLIVNELLFNPNTGGSDFVELYNRSQKVINLKGLRMTNYRTSPILINKDYLVFPDAYVVITPDSMYQKNNFPTAVTGTFFQNSLPSLNTDSSTFALYYNTTLLDKVSYQSSWHFSLIDNQKNKSLERVDPWGVSDSKSNWHTAAETVNFATPGRINSQHVGGNEANGEFSVKEPIFSPDNDGFQDLLFFEFNFPSSMIGTLKIFDNQGRETTKLFANELMGTTGFYTWDGTISTGQKAPIGVYIAVFEAFSEDGTAQFAKRIGFTLAGKLD